MKLLIFALTPFLFAVGVVIGFMYNPMHPEAVELDLEPVNRKLMRLLVE